MATFEEQLNNLLERTHSIKSPINAAAIGKLLCPKASTYHWHDEYC